MRFRNIYLGIGSLLVILLWVLSDPDANIIQSLPVGASTVAMLVILLKAVLYVGVLHLSRKALLDYLDIEQYFKKAFQTPEGAGKALQSVGLICIAISIVILASVVM